MTQPITSVPEVDALSKALAQATFAFNAHFNGIDLKPKKVDTGPKEPIPYLDYLPQVCPTTWNTKAPHIKLIAEHLDAVTRGDIDRLAIFLPPRHSKTESVTIRYPVYRLESNPDMNCLITGYNERIARKFARRSRIIAEERFGLAKDKKAADEWETAAGGTVMARGVGSPPTGVGFGLIMIDDPIRRREDAESEVYRDKMWEWYTSDLYSRLEPEGAIILCVTRWHHDDIAARAIASEPGRWTVVKLPALAEEGDLLGREVGQSLWPERYNEEALERIRSVLTGEGGAYAFESLYQQNPTPKEGAFFRVAQLKTDTFVPEKLKMCRAWDLAASSGKGDYTVGVKVGVDDDGRYFILDVVRAQLMPDERNDLIKRTAASDGDECIIRLTRDPGQAGIDQVLYLTRMLAGYPVRDERATGSKQVRADNLASQINVGNVTLQKAPWNPAYIEEFRQFPSGKHDDQVDATADALNELVNKAVSIVWAWA